jgi:hypothetical protein
MKEKDKERVSTARKHTQLRSSDSEGAALSNLKAAEVAHSPSLVCTLARFKPCRPTESPPKQMAVDSLLN